MEAGEPAKSVCMLGSLLDRRRRSVSIEMLLRNVTPGWLLRSELPSPEFGMQPKLWKWLSCDKGSHAV